MFEVINELKEQKRRLTSSFNQHKNKYQTKISRIDRAINNFERGIKELQEDALQPQSRVEQIEEILRRHRRPMHLKQILKELSRTTGFEPPYQSLSRLIQSHTKTNKRFTRTGPGTFALAENDEGKHAGGRRK